MEGSTITSGSEDEDDRLLASQSEHGMYDWMKRHYGKLNRNEFKKSLIAFSVSDLTIYRCGLYMVAKNLKADTPEGDLVVRKDTSNRGGCSAKEKLSEDIYTLYHYLEGDISMDLTKMFTERSKKKYVATAEETCSSHTDQMTNTVDMKDFVLKLLTEMRLDRDLLVKEISVLKSDNGLLKRINEDINGIRAELSNTRDRVSRLETHRSESNVTLIATDSDDNEQSDFDLLNRKQNKIMKSMNKLQKRVQTVEQSISGIRNAGNQINARVASNNADLTQRLNSLELARPSSRRPSLSPDHLATLGRMTPLTRGPRLPPSSGSPTDSNVSDTNKQLRFCVRNTNVSPVGLNVSSSAAQELSHDDDQTFPKSRYIAMSPGRSDTNSTLSEHNNNRRTNSSDSHSSVQPPAVAPHSGVQQPAVEPHSGVQQPAVASHSGVQQPTVAPHSGVQQPAVAPHSGVQQPAVVPHSGVQQPAVAPHSGVQQPAFAPHSGVQQSSFVPHSGVQQTAFAPHSGVRQPAFAPYSGVQQPAFAPHSGVQQPVFASHSGVQQPISAPHSGVQQPGFAPYSGVRQPAFPPHSGVQHPVFAPHSGVQQPAFTPHSGVQQPAFAPHSGVQQPAFAPHSGVQQPAFAPHSGVQQPAVAPHSGVQQPAFVPQQIPQHKNRHIYPGQQHIQTPLPLALSAPPKGLGSPQRRVNVLKVCDQYPDLQTLSVEVHRNGSEIPSAQKQGDETSCHQLKGFVAASGRSKHTLVYLAGIIAVSQNIDDTMQCIYTYLKDKKCEPKSIKKLKESGNTVSVKVLIPVECVDAIIAEGFWPEGIICRKWIY